ncbi:MAG: class I SAM-dependent methyltransferase [Planctomycetota bacterium]|jgi:SAM-dependent methyltransferase
MAQNPLSTDPKQIVREGYDRVSAAYRADSAAGAEAKYLPWVTSLSKYLDRSAAVLDLGCGNGVPATQQLARRFEVTGVDISQVQIQRARRLIPLARFICQDMCDLRFDRGTFDAIASFYAIIHVPLDEQPALFHRIAEWLKPGGHFLGTLGERKWTGIENDWLGVRGARMYWSHADSSTYCLWLRQSGFEVLSANFVPERDGGHCLVHALRVI